MPPVIFLFYGISSPGEEAEPLAEPLPVWLPRCGKEGTLTPSSVLDPWASGVGYPQWCPLLPPYPGHAATFSPLSQSGRLFQAPSSLALDTSRDWPHKSHLSACHASRLPVPGALSLTWLTPGVSQSALASSPCPSEEDEVLQSCCCLG